MTGSARRRPGLLPWIALHALICILASSSPAPVRADSLTGEIAGDIIIIASSQGSRTKEEKSGDPSKRYRWLFKEQREEESPRQVQQAAPILDHLDGEIKKARKLYLSGETENGLLTYRSAIDLLESAVDDVPPGHPFLKEIEDRLPLYEELATKILGPIHLEPRDDTAGQVFHLMEKRRICRRNLALKKAGVLRFFDVPGDLVSEEAAILRKLMDMRTTPSTGGARRMDEELRAKLVQVRKSLKASSERYALFRGGVPLSLDEARKELLRDDEVLLDFNLFPDRLVIGVITTEKVAYHQIAGNRQEIDKGVFNLQEKLKEFFFGDKASFMGHAWKEPCRRMHRALFSGLPGLAREKSTVFVIPDRSLWYLPVPALLDSEDRPFGADRIVTTIPSADMLKFVRSCPAGAILGQDSSDLVLMESVPWIAEDQLRAHGKDSKGQKKTSEGEKLEQLVLANAVYPKATEIVEPARKLFKKCDLAVGPAATVDRFMQHRGKAQNVTILGVPLAMNDSVRPDRQPCFLFSPDKQGRRRFEASRFFADPVGSRIMIMPLAWFDVPDKNSPTGEGPLLLVTSMLYAGVQTALTNYSDPNWGPQEPFLLTVLEKAAENGSLAEVWASYPHEIPAGLESSFSGRPPAWTGWILMGDPGR